MSEVESLRSALVRIAAAARRAERVLGFVDPDHVPVVGAALTDVDIILAEAVRALGVEAQPRRDQEPATSTVPTDRWSPTMFGPAQRAAALRLEPLGTDDEVTVVIRRPRVATKATLPVPNVSMRELVSTPRGDKP